jgi:hypothetical protein
MQFASCAMQFAMAWPYITMHSIGFHVTDGQLAHNTAVNGIVENGQ